MEPSTLNPKIFPNAPMLKPVEHKRHLTMAVTIAVIAIAFGVIYWFIVSRQPEPVSVVVPVINHDEALRNRMLAILRDANVPPPSKEETDRMLADLKSAKAPPPSDATRSAMLEQIRNSK